jgi:hypothetical protein
MPPHGIVGRLAIVSRKPTSRWHSHEGLDQGHQISLKKRPVI